MMKITGLSDLFKWENLHNWWLTKYFFAPLYIYIYTQQADLAYLLIFSIFNTIFWKITEHFIFSKMLILFEVEKMDVH